MNYNPTPQSVFLRDPELIKIHHALVEREDLRSCLNIALLEMQRRSANGTDPANFNACAASHLRILGAQDFISIFLNLAEQMQPASKTDTTNLPSNTPSRRN